MKLYLLYTFFIDYDCRFRNCSKEELDLLRCILVCIEGSRLIYRWVNLVYSLLVNKCKPLMEWNWKRRNILVLYDFLMIFDCRIAVNRIIRFWIFGIHCMIDCIICLFHSCLNISFMDVRLEQFRTWNLILKLFVILKFLYFT